MRPGRIFDIATMPILRLCQYNSSKIMLVVIVVVVVVVLVVVAPELETKPT